MEAIRREDGARMSWLQCKRFFPRSRAIMCRVLASGNIIVICYHRSTHEKFPLLFAIAEPSFVFRLRTRWRQGLGSLEFSLALRMTLVRDEEGVFTQFTKS